MAPERGWGHERVIGWLLFGEILLFLSGALLGHPFLGAAAASALLYGVFAYQRPLLGWALIWFAFPFSIEMRIPGGNAIYVPTEPMIMLWLAAGALRLPLRGPLRAPPSRFHAPLIALAAVALASAALSPFPLLGLKAWFVAVAYAGFGFAFPFLHLGNNDRASRWIPWVVGAAAGWGLYGTARVLLAGVSVQHAYGAARPFFPEHGTYSAYLSMLLPLSLLSTLEGEGRARLLYALATILIGFGIALSFTRAAWVSLILILPLAVGVWAVRRRSLKPLAWAGGLAAVVLIAVAGIGAEGRIVRHASSVVESENASNLERVNRWMAAVEMAKDRPWLGMGYGTYPAAYPNYRRKVILTEEVYFHMGAHSEPLRVLSETGIAGVLVSGWLIFVAVGLGISAYARAARPRTGMLALAALSGLGTYLIHSVFNSYPGIDKVTIPFWTSLGILGALGREP